MGDFKNRRSGIIHLKIDGYMHSAKVGTCKYNLGMPKNEGFVNASGQAEGYKSTGQIPFIECEIYDNHELDLKKLCRIDDSTAELNLANGKTIILRNCWFAGTGETQTEEANIAFRLEGLSAEELK